MMEKYYKCIKSLTGRFIEQKTYKLQYHVQGSKYPFHFINEEGRSHIWSEELLNVYFKEVTFKFGR